MTKDIWQSKETGVFFGDNSDLNEFNRQKGGIMFVENETALEIISSTEAPMPTPAVVMTNKQKKKATEKAVKIVNVAATRNGIDVDIEIFQAESEAPMVMPSCLDAGSLGYSSPSMIQGGEQGDIDKRMRQCLTKEDREELEEQETPMNPMPPVVGK